MRGMARSGCKERAIPGMLFDGEFPKADANPESLVKAPGCVVAPVGDKAVNRRAMRMS